MLTDRYGKRKKPREKKNKFKVGDIILFEWKGKKNTGMVTKVLYNSSGSFFVKWFFPPNWLQIQTTEESPGYTYVTRDTRVAKESIVIG
jgi:hypothetical protein